MHLAGRTLDLGLLVERLAETRTQQVDVGAGLRQQMPDGTSLLIEQGRHQMNRLDNLVATANRQRLGVAECELKFAGQFVLAHRESL